MCGSYIDDVEMTVAAIVAAQWPLWLAARLELVG
ncbi:hypothetical protein FBZ99_10929 [Rhizobium sp. ERR 1071]|nr:hypothetical protein FBZ99_10929 [Rhizobium sp. ERR1071]